MGSAAAIAKRMPRRHSANRKYASRSSWISPSRILGTFLADGTLQLRLDIGHVADEGIASLLSSVCLSPPLLSSVQSQPCLYLSSASPPHNLCVSSPLASPLLSLSSASALSLFPFPYPLVWVEQIMSSDRLHTVTTADERHQHAQNTLPTPLTVHRRHHRFNWRLQQKLRQKNGAKQKRRQGKRWRLRWLLLRRRSRAGEQSGAEPRTRQGNMGPFTR